jgi:hypothetical protein
MSHIVHLPCELLHMMQAKIACRLLKLDSIDPEMNLDPVASLVRRVTESLATRWTQIQKKGEPDCHLSHLKPHKFSDDSLHNLRALDEYIEKLPMREVLCEDSLFDRQSSFVRLQDGLLPDLPSTPDSEHRTLNLLAFEVWVGRNLNTWIMRHQSEDATCTELGKLIRTYHKVAAPIYREDPVATSIMILTTLELWIACDKSATLIDSTVSEYDIRIPVHLCQCLLLGNCYLDLTLY